MKLTRRQFLKSAAIAGAGLALPLKWNVRSSYAFAQSPIISKFGNPLPGLAKAHQGSGQYIPFATKTATIPFANKPTDLYDMAVRQFDQQILPLPNNKTTFWGYSNLIYPDQQYLGGVIVVQRGRPVLLTVTNLLPNQHILPVDNTIMAGPEKIGGPNLMVGDLPVNRIATHLHGGLTPWFSDGTPFQWFTPTGQHGPSFMNVPGLPSVPGTATYYYPNDQSARMVWYHDHAIGITRLNAYAGIASAYIITDDFETYLRDQKFIPTITAPYLHLGIPLIIQDKTFLDPEKDRSYPVKGAMRGDLWYPHLYESNQGAGTGYPAALVNNQSGRWDYGPGGPNFVPPSPAAILPDGTTPNPSFYFLPSPSAVPEFFADTAMVNGAPYPVVKVKANDPSGYNTFRLRFLNGSQARFYHLNLYLETSPGECTATPANGGKPDIGTATAAPVTLYQIGTEGGFLPAVAELLNGTPCPMIDPDTANPDGPFNLLLAPAERADVLVEIPSSVPNGAAVIVYNDAPGPFPGGDPRNDYYTGDPDFTSPGPSATNPYPLSGGAVSTLSGQGPNTRTIMKIVVDNDKGVAGAPINLPTIRGALDIALGNNFTTGNGSVPAQQPPLLAPFTGGHFVVPSGTPIFRKTLNEDFDEFGRLIQKGGTGDLNGKNNQGQDTYARGYLEPATETPNAGDVQVWDFYNTTGDTHPWHFHLINVQIIGRAGFSSVTEPTRPDADFTPPDDNERGWKETVRMNPGEITRVIMQFDLPTLPKVMGNPLSPRTGGHEYVHHCHILEHEEHDMMRPLVVK